MCQAVAAVQSPAHAPASSHSAPGPGAHLTLGDLDVNKVCAAVSKLRDQDGGSALAQLTALHSGFTAFWLCPELWALMLQCYMQMMFRCA